MCLKRIFVCAFSLQFVFFVSAQTSNENVYDWFDSFVGDENAELYNGVIFVDEFKVTNDKHRFFKTDDFIQGSVSYNGNTFYNHQLKYDLFKDELLIKPKTASSALILQIVKNKIDSFSLKEKKFVNIITSRTNDSKSEFYEKFFKYKSITILKKHYSLNKGKTDEKLFYEFRYKSNFFLQYKDVVYPADTQSNIIAIFPDQKKDIKKIYRKNKILRKSNPNSFMQYLIRQLEIFHTD
ncbi:MAG: hypothetical protein NWQ38_14605 [Cellulophaga sp.]|nr:hypothetical protein [Cellulophaga sp.]